ncbi:MAG: peptidylprolyl isomerase [Deltaproteobacteria bacterium]|nr:peptidylprolyl isomerase [Deltaproteobacteria bacterium]MBW2098380.1 peptidylprolyl isomerase [Deltaproteobacteria bacterium]PXF50523.1 MAG: peptidylprolyl isomerase [Deltaproteobacteria bacterium]
MAQAKSGDTVKVHYTGKLEDGTVFDTSANRDPLEFTIGDGKIIPSFEQGVVGMSPGESRTTEIPADNAYGPHRREMVVEIDRNQFPAEVNPKVGERLQIPQKDGKMIIVAVTDVSESTVTLDANHPLAGKDLTFDIELVEIV